MLFVQKRSSSWRTAFSSYNTPSAHGFYYPDRLITVGSLSLPRAELPLLFGESDQRRKESEHVGLC